MNPKVSVIIPTYNKVDLLRKTLESLSEQNISPTAFEVIVVDDGSSDGTRDFLGSLKSNFSLRCVWHDTNRGRAAARNSGVAQAEGELVVFLDDDMVVVPGFLRAHIRCHDGADSADPSVGRVVIGNVIPAKQVPGDRLNRYLATRGVHKLPPGEAVPFRYFVTNNSSLRRSDLIRVGPFDERLVAWGGEDLELGYRLKEMGLEFFYCPSAISYHTHFRTLEEVCRLSETFGEQSVPILVRKCPVLRSTLWLDFEEPMRLSRDTLRRSLKKILLRITMKQPIYQAVKAFTSLFNRIYVPMWIFDYLLVYTRYRGFRITDDTDNR